MTAPRYAGFWHRSLATFVDSLRPMPVLGQMQLAHSTRHRRWAEQQRAPYAIYGPAGVSINSLVPLALAGFFWGGFRGAPSKLIFGCKVEDIRTGRALGVGQAVLRWFVYCVSTMPSCLGFPWIAWNHRKQGFYEEIACSAVIREATGNGSLPTSLEAVRR